MYSIVDILAIIAEIEAEAEALKESSEQAEDIVLISQAAGMYRACNMFTQKMLDEWVLDEVKS